jgi:hypothetical protein
MSWLERLLHPDRRKNRRKNSPQMVAFYWDGAIPSPHEVYNISATGLFLETAKRWRTGTLVTMTVQRAGNKTLVNGEKDYIVLLSRVIWSDEYGAGLQIMPRDEAIYGEVKFAKSAPAGKRLIEQFLER